MMKEQTHSEVEEILQASSPVPVCGLILFSHLLLEPLLSTPRKNLGNQGALSSLISHCWGILLYIQSKYFLVHALSLLFPAPSISTVPKQTYLLT